MYSFQKKTVHQLLKLVWTTVTETRAPNLKTVASLQNHWTVPLWQKTFTIPDRFRTFFRSVPIRVNCVPPGRLDYLFPPLERTPRGPSHFLIENWSLSQNLKGVIGWFLKLFLCIVTCGVNRAPVVTVPGGDCERFLYGAAVCVSWSFRLIFPHRKSVYTTGE